MLRRKNSPSTTIEIDSTLSPCPRSPNRSISQFITKATAISPNVCTSTVAKMTGAAMARLRIMADTSLNRCAIDGVINSKGQCGRSNKHKPAARLAADLHEAIEGSLRVDIEAALGTA
jgi:hypothetical protein